MMDAFALLAGLTLAGYLLEGESRVGEVMSLASILVALWFVIFVAWDLYVRRQSRRCPWDAAPGLSLRAQVLLVLGSIMYPQLVSPHRRLCSGLY